MKKQFTILVCALCLTFTGFAQVQLGNSINGTAVGGTFGASLDMSADGSRVAIDAPTEGNLGTLRFYDYGTDWEAFDAIFPFTGTNSNLGFQVRLSNDGQRMAAIDNEVGGAFYSYQYNASSNQWQLGSVIDHEQHLSTDLSGNGERIVLGEMNQTKVYNSVGNTQVGNTIPERADFVSISDDGNRIAISNAETNVFHSYEYDGTSWIQGTDSAAEFGGDIAISGDGMHIAIESVSFVDASVWSFDGQSQIGSFIGHTGEGRISLDLSADGNRIAIASKGIDATRVYEFDGTAWGKINETITFSGGEVAISDDGATIAIGDPDYEVAGVGVVGQVRAYGVDEVNAVTNIQATDINVFPNPTAGFLQLQNVAANEVTVFDNVGKTVMTVQQPGTSMDISSLPIGFYILKIGTDEGIFSAKVIKE